MMHLFEATGLLRCEYRIKSGDPAANRSRGFARGLTYPINSEHCSDMAISSEAYIVTAKFPGC